MIAKLMSDASSSILVRNARLPADQQLPPIAFAVVDVETAPVAFREKMRLETVPHMYFLEVRRFGGRQTLTLTYLLLLLLLLRARRGSPPRPSSAFTNKPRYPSHPPRTQANTAYRFPLGPDAAVHFDYDDGMPGLVALLKERAGITVDPVPDLGVTVHAAAALAVLLALAVFLREWRPWRFAVPSLIVCFPFHSHACCWQRGGSLGSSTAGFKRLNPHARAHPLQQTKTPLQSWTSGSGPRRRPSTAGCGSACPTPSSPAAWAAWSTASSVPRRLLASRAKAASPSSPCDRTFVTAY